MTSTDDIRIEVLADDREGSVVVMARVRLTALQAAFENAQTGPALLQTITQRMQDRLVELAEPKLIEAAAALVTPERVQAMLQHAVDGAAAKILEQILAKLMKP
jgi:hypothetical protein